MSLEMWSQVKKFSDGDSLNADTLNLPIGQLGDRTAYLYNKLKSLLSKDAMSSVVLTNVPLSTETGKTPVVGNAVYFDKDSKSFAAAKATMSLCDDFTAAESAFTVGILIFKDNDSPIGNVLAYGRTELNYDGEPIKVANMIESGESFRPGRYYLSANEAGKLSAHPNGPLIYVCTIDGETNDTYFSSGSAIVTPQFLDMGTSHVHRTAVLTARPAGTIGTGGYLPNSYDSEHPEWSPALRFGGTWTANNKVSYKFSLADPSAYWPTGVKLLWTEVVDGKSSPVFSKTIHAPDEVVELSNGLNVRLSLPYSDPNTAYSGLSDENQREWPELVFPDAGKGWLDHEANAVAETSSIEGLKVAIRGRFDYSPLEVNVAFPGRLQTLELNEISEGTTFAYSGSVYEFTLDAESYSGDNIPVPVGTCLADSALYLASELSKRHSGGQRFAVYEEDSGSVAYLLVMDGDTVDGSQDVIKSVEPDVTQSQFNVVGATSVNIVVFDGNGRVVGAAPAFNVKSYVWNDIGDMSVMIYQVSDGDVTVPAGTVVSTVVTDYEPDAIYDYVLGMDPQLSNYWPPVPPKSAALVVNGVEMDNKALFPDNPTVSFGRDTIHWFEDDEDRKPWPEAFVSRDAEIDPALDKTETMHWVRGFQGATGPVTSIQPKPGSPIKIYGYGTFDGANTGDLEIAADFDFKVENGGIPGFLVPKRAVNGSLVAGPVVERIIGGAGVSVISMAGCPNGQGTVIVALDNGAYRNQFSDIALENAEQAKIGMFPYIRIRGYQNTITSPSAFTAVMRVPTSLPDGTYELRLQASVFGEVGFVGVSKQTACVKLSYNILPDYNTESGIGYSNLKTGLMKPDHERNILIPFGHESGEGVKYDGFDPIVIMTDDEGVQEEDDVVQKVLGEPIPSRSEFNQQTITPELRPGYLVGIRISRAVAQGTGITPYTGALGFINLSWSLVAKQDSWRGATNPVSPLDGVQIRANTPAGIRSAVETMGERLGATVVRSVGR